MLLLDCILNSFSETFLLRLFLGVMINRMHILNFYDICEVRYIADYWKLEGSSLFYLLLSFFKFTIVKNRRSKFRGEIPLGK